jgi:hypothetical protein
MSKQLDMFKTNLEEFASKHKQEIRKNPEFRVQFQDMCATIGVDPLACKELPVGSRLVEQLTCYVPSVGHL